MAGSEVIRYIDEPDDEDEEDNYPDVRWQGDEDPGSERYEIEGGDAAGRGSRKQGLAARLSSLSLAEEDASQDVLGMLSPDLFLHHDADTNASTTDTGVKAWSCNYAEVRFKDVMSEVYRRAAPVHVSLLALEPIPSALLFFNQYRVVLELQHAGFRWQVHTRLKNITSLHNKLALYRVKLRVPAATQKARDRRNSLRQQLQHGGDGRARRQSGEGVNSNACEADTGDCSTPGNPTLHMTPSYHTSSSRSSSKRAVKFPRKSLARMDNNTADDLQLYLRNLMLHPLFRSHRDVLALFEISALSFVPGFGCKLKEGFVKKRSGGYAAGDGCCAFISCRLCENCAGQYRERWLVLKDSYLFFIAPLTGKVRGVMLMDRDFQVSNGFRHTGINNGLVITSLSRRLVMMCDNDQSEKDWSAEIRRVQYEHAADFCSRGNRHNSFAPIRHAALANWYVDGNRYMWDVADAIDGAQEEIYITDWWLSPDIYMKRPDLTATQWRLSEVLRRAAARNVKVFVLLYKEVELALGLNSLYTKHALDNMHENIKVLRHPDHGGGGTLYWAHHEKLVIIDQQHAFVSGIDLCYGRWDDYRHRLVDLGYAGIQKKAPPAAAAGTTGTKIKNDSATDSKRKSDTKVHRASHSSIGHLVMGTQLLMETVQNATSMGNSPADTAPSSPVLPPKITHCDEENSQSSSSKQSTIKRRPLDSSVPLQSDTDNKISGQINTAATFGSESSLPVTPDDTDAHHKALSSSLDISASVNDKYSTSVSLSTMNFTSDSATYGSLNVTQTTEIDKTKSSGDSSAASSLRNIPDIVEEIVRRRRQKQMNASQLASNKSNSEAEQQANSTSDDELLPDSVDTTPAHNRATAKLQLEKDRPSSDPVRISMRKLSSFLPKGSSIRKQKRSRTTSDSVRRRNSLEMIDAKTGKERLRRCGTKSDGDDLSADERCNSKSIQDTRWQQQDNYTRQPNTSRRDHSPRPDHSPSHHSTSRIDDSPTIEIYPREDTYPGDTDYSKREDPLISESIYPKGSGGRPGRRVSVAANRKLGAVKNRGRDLVGGMKSKGTDVKNWTRRKMPVLNRVDSANSEAEMEVVAKRTKKSVGRWKERVLTARGRQQKQNESGRAESTVSSLLLDHAPTLYDSPSVHLWVGKDYVNWITKDLANPDEPFSDSVDRRSTPRMPWHDIGLYVEGPAARDAARHFVQRWNAVKNEKVKSNEKYPYLLPRTYDPNSFTPARSMLHRQRVTCQVVRSVGEWSAGQHESERSIYNAYVAAIRDSEHYIYVENQFFISLSSGASRGDVQNRIATAIVDRIVRAHRSNRKFRVFVVLPLLPAFEGQIGTPSGTAMQFLLHYTYSTIVRGENSLLSTLEKQGVSDWRDYISFSSLRSHDWLDGHLVSELIYIHSKLLIVDDRLVIAGSANINDRSMLGTRDSEVALLIQDEEFEDGLMNGEPYQRGKFAGSLRQYLFSEHLGLIADTSATTADAFSNKNKSGSRDTTDDARSAALTFIKNALSSINKTKDTADVSPGDDATSLAAAKALRQHPKATLKDIVDPISDHFFKDVWLFTAATNTNIYDDVFSCYPTDRVQTFDAVNKLRCAVPLATTNPSEASAALAGVQGNVVQFPLLFLSEEELKPGIGTKEALLPADTWT